MVESYNILLSERSQTLKPHKLGFHIYKMFKIGKSLKLENRLLVARARVRGNRELMLKDNMFIFIIRKI